MSNIDLKDGGYVERKYKQFYEKNGYIPEMFNPYNCAEITDICPTLSTYCGSTTSNSTVLIIERRKRNE